MQDKVRASLAEEMRCAARAVQRLVEGKRLDQALDEVWLGAALAPASRAPVRDMAYACVRQLGLCQALAALLNARPPAAGLAALQYVAIAQLLEPIRHPATIVDQAVVAARSEPTSAPAAGFLNATLRRLLRDREALLARATNDPVGRWNYPSWWTAQLRRDHPRHWEQILQAGNQHPPFSLRVNRRHIETDAYMALLAQQGLVCRQVGPWALIVDPACPVQALPGWSQGWVSVQDAGAQLAAPWLGVREGDRVLDACAAPGGKSAHLLELVDCRLTALELDADRMRSVAQNLSRLGLRADLRVGDARQPSSWWDGQAYDRILVDAPCSASGIVRRAPDARWLRRRSDLATLAQQQRQILDSLWPLLKPGGRLLYVTCSVFHDEGRALARGFAQTHAEARLLPLDEGPDAGADPARPGRQLLPATGPGQDHDGFFYCLFEKRLSDKPSTEIRP